MRLIDARYRRGENVGESRPPPSQSPNVPVGGICTVRGNLQRNSSDAHTTAPVVYRPPKARSPVIVGLEGIAKDGVVWEVWERQGVKPT